MRKNYINTTAEYYRRREDELDLFMGAFGTASWMPFAAPERKAFQRFKKLLVIDDEAKIRDNYRRIFSRQGFEVLTAASAMEAKDILVREDIGLVFLDINMAEVNGQILFELIRTFHPNVKVIVSSVYSVEEQREKIRNADAYYDKADDKKILTGMVSAMAWEGDDYAGNRELFPPMF